MRLILITTDRHHLRLAWSKAIGMAANSARPAGSTALWAGLPRLQLAPASTETPPPAAPAPAPAPAPAAID